MFHHDARDYKTATSEAAKRGREKMEAIITKGRDSAVAVWKQVVDQVPQDKIVPTYKLEVVSQGTDGFALTLPGVDPVRLHDHALTQLAVDVKFRKDYLSHLNAQGDWGRTLIQHNFKELLSHQDQKVRNLVRTVTTKDGPEVRGVVSDRFRRIDSRPLLDAFIGAVKEFGAVPIEGVALDTKVRMRAVLPMVFEPVENEVMLFGLEWGNSDFGDGGHRLSLFNTRVWCTNMAVLDEVLRQIHLGRRLDDNLMYSQQTLELDTQANASAMKDVVRKFLAPDQVNNYLEHIREACESVVGEKDITRLLKARLGKAELEKVTTLFNGPDVINLPAGHNAYRLSNALSWFAQDETVNAPRRLALQELAGEMMPAMTVAKVREV